MSFDGLAGASRGYYLNFIARFRDVRFYAKDPVFIAVGTPRRICKQTFRAQTHIPRRIPHLPSKNGGFSSVNGRCVRENRVFTPSTRRKSLDDIAEAM